MIHLAADLVFDLIRLVMGLMTLAGVAIGVHVLPKAWRVHRRFRAELEAKALIAEAERVEQQDRDERAAARLAQLDEFDAQLGAESFRTLHPAPATPHYDAIMQARLSMNQTYEAHAQNQQALGMQNDPNYNVSMQAKLANGPPRSDW